jgi:insertion element IS1 protein InsB
VALHPKKQRKLWIWLAYSRAQKRIIACEVGSRSAKTLKRLWARIQQRKPFAVCADEWKAYRQIIPANLLIQSKKYTHNIEAQNSSLRDFIKRFNRKTKAYSKATDMAEYAVYLHFFNAMID